jgi:hypothetical protein
MFLASIEWIENIVELPWHTIQDSV